MADATASVKGASPLTGGAARALHFFVWFVRRLAYALPTVAGVIVLDFFLLQLAPGDYASYSAAISGTATEETMAQVRERLGLDRSVAQQFWDYITGLPQGDLGYSSLYSQPVWDVITDRLPNTILLVSTTLAFALVVGTVIGVINAAFAHRARGKLITAAIVLVYSTPSFLKGLFLVVLFSVTLRWLPSTGYATIGADLGFFGTIADRIRFLILPVITLSLFYVAVYARIVNASMLDVRKQNYIRTARAKGLPERRITYRHMLRNALMPLTTVAGMHVGMMLSGAVIVETIFSWPGLGGLAYDALFARDFQLVLGILLLSSLMVVASNILVDVVQKLIDPRIRE